MNEHPKQLPNIWILEAFPSESSTKGANSIDNIIRTCRIVFLINHGAYTIIHLWSPTITHTGNTVCVSYVQVHLGKLWHTTTSTDLAQLHLTCHCLTEICQWLVWLFMMVLDHPKIISKWRDDYKDTLQGTNNAWTSEPPTFIMNQSLDLGYSGRLPHRAASETTSPRHGEGGAVMST